MKTGNKKMNITCRFLTGIATLLLLPLAGAWAENVPQDYQPFSLGEVVVSADRPDKEGPATIAKVTAEDIERQNATNLGEALKLVPGVFFRQGRSKEGYYVTMRGFEQENILILLDGIPIGVPYEGLVNLADIPVQNISEIKVIKGNASVLYGPNAMGGVINIITKKGTSDVTIENEYYPSLVYTPDELPYRLGGGQIKPIENHCIRNVDTCGFSFYFTFFVSLYFTYSLHKLVLIDSQTVHA
ncbi:MAG: Plug domain-containing protein [Pseudomonadota bacterium]